MPSLDRVGGGNGVHCARRTYCMSDTLVEMEGFLEDNLCSGTVPLIVNSSSETTDKSLTDALALGVGTHVMYM